MGLLERTDRGRKATRMGLGMGRGCLTPEEMRSPHLTSSISCTGQAVIGEADGVSAITSQCGISIGVLGNYAW